MNFIIILLSFLSLSVFAQDVDTEITLPMFRDQPISVRRFANDPRKRHMVLKEIVLENEDISLYLPRTGMIDISDSGNYTFSIYGNPPGFNGEAYLKKVATVNNERLYLRYSSYFLIMASNGDIVGTRLSVDPYGGDPDYFFIQFGNVHLPCSSWFRFDFVQGKISGCTLGYPVNVPWNLHDETRGMVLAGVTSIMRPHYGHVGYFTNGVLKHLPINTHIQVQAEDGSSLQVRGYLTFNDQGKLVGVEGP